jgi:hypothetical protein
MDSELACSTPIRVSLIRRYKLFLNLGAFLGGNFMADCGARLQPLSSSDYCCLYFEFNSYGELSVL